MSKYLKFIKKLELSPSDNPRVILKIHAQVPIKNSDKTQRRELLYAPSNSPMLNQVTRALSALFRPIATHHSSEDRDPAGNAYENLNEKEKDEDKAPDSAPMPEEPQPQPQLAAPVQAPPEEDELERRRKAIANSQAWVGLVTELEKQKTALGEQIKASGAGVYEKANTGSSRAARAKKGVILDKKAA